MGSWGAESTMNRGKITVWLTVTGLSIKKRGNARFYYPFLLFFPVGCHHRHRVGIWNEGNGYKSFWYGAFHPCF